MEEECKGREFSPWAGSGDTAGASQEWTPFVEGGLAAKPNKATTCTFFEGLVTIPWDSRINRIHYVSAGMREGERGRDKERMEIENLRRNCDNKPRFHSSDPAHVQVPLRPPWEYGKGQGTTMPINIPQARKDSVWNG